MKLIVRVSFALAVLLGALTPIVAQKSEQPKPNVVFLAVDDLKDWVNCLGDYEGTVHTPNIDRLAKCGMLFTNAHCPSPKCAPSRAFEFDPDTFTWTHKKSGRKTVGK